jgi:hypothetical protein
MTVVTKTQTDQWINEWKSSAELQSEFTQEQYVGYMIARTKGHGRRFGRGVIDHHEAGR